MILYGSLGLGDAIYLYPIVKHCSEVGEKVTIITRYPEVYDGLKCETVDPGEFISCRISARTTILESNIFQDALTMSGIKENIPLKLEYKNKNVIKFKTDKKVCVIRNITVPAAGEDDAKVMVPDISVYQRIIDEFKNSVYFVLIGRQTNSDAVLTGIDLDLTKTSTLSEYFSVIDSADIVLTQPGHCVPIAEALDKNLFVIFAWEGLLSEAKRFRFTTPKKLLTKESSFYCVDNEVDSSFLRKFRKALR